MGLKESIANNEKEIVVKGRHIDVATAFSLFDKEKKYEFVKELGACEFLYRLKFGKVIEHQGFEDEYYCECSICKTKEVCLGDKYCSECGVTFIQN